MAEYEHKQAFNERYRYMKGRLTMLYIAVVAVFVIPFCIVMFLHEPWQRMIAFVVVIVAASVLFRNINSIKEELKTLNSYAAGVILEQKLSSVENYDPFSMMNSDVVSQLNLPMNWNGGEGSDLVQGTYRGLPLSFSDVKLTHTTRDSDGDSNTSTTFKGQVFTLGMKQPLQGRVWIGKTPFGWQRIQEQRMGVEIPYVAALEKQNVYASSTLAADAILTDSYLPTLRDAFNQADDKLYLCFNGDILYGALYSKDDLFEGKGDKDWEELVNQSTLELDKLLGLIDILTNNAELFARTDAA